MLLNQALVNISTSFCQEAISDPAREYMYDNNEVDDVGEVGV